jgi:hypothetical protein
MLSCTETGIYVFKCKYRGYNSPVAQCCLGKFFVLYLAVYKNYRVLNIVLLIKNIKLSSFCPKIL